MSYFLRIALFPLFVFFFIRKTEYSYSLLNRFANRVEMGIFFYSGNAANQKLLTVHARCTINNIYIAMSTLKPSLTQLYPQSMKNK